MTRLSPSARALIDQALLEEEPTVADRARNRTGLASRIAAGGVIASTSAAAASAKITGLAKLFALFAFAGTFGVALSVDPVDPVVPVAVTTAAPTEAPRRAMQPAVLNQPHEAPIDRQSEPQREAQPDSKPEAKPTEATATEANATQATATEQDTLKAETALVRKAHLALRGGDANGALALLDQHAREFPQGQLREERAAARVLALCRLGRKDEAKRAAGRMLDERSPLAERIRSACGF